MKLLLSFLVSGCVSFVVPSAQAQRQLNNYDMANLANNGGGSTANPYLPSNTELVNYKVGSLPAETYISSTWQAGQLLSISGKSPAISRMRYNVFAHTLEIEDSSVAGGIRLQPVGSVKGFTLLGEGAQGSRQFISTPFYSRRTGNSRDFLEVLNQKGTIQLLVLHQVVEKPAQYNAVLNTEISPASWKRHAYLFARRLGQSELAEEMQLNRKAIQRLFAERAPQLDEYATRNGLDYRKVEDVVKMVEEYNRLTAQP